LVGFVNVVTNLNSRKEKRLVEYVKEDILKKLRRLKKHINEIC